MFFRATSYTAASPAFKTGSPFSKSVSGFLISSSSSALSSLFSSVTSSGVSSVSSFSFSSCFSSVSVTSCRLCSPSHSSAFTVPSLSSIFSTSAPETFSQFPQFPHKNSNVKITAAASPACFLILFFINTSLIFCFPNGFFLPNGMK